MKKQISMLLLAGCLISCNNQPEVIAGIKLGGEFKIDRLKHYDEKYIYYDLNDGTIARIDYRTVKKKVVHVFVTLGNEPFGTFSEGTSKDNYDAFLQKLIAKYGQPESVHWGTQEYTNNCIIYWNFPNYHIFYAYDTSNLKNSLSYSLNDDVIDKIEHSSDEKL